MKRQWILSCMLASALAAHAAVVVDDDFSAGTDGDLGGQGAWVTSTNNAFVLDGNDEVTLLIDGTSLLLDSAMQMLPGDSVTMTINHRYSIDSANADANWSPWQFGLQDNADADGGSQSLTSWISWNGYASGTMKYYPMSDQWWVGSSPGAFASASTEMGCDPGGNDGPIDADSDPMQVVYTITKSDVSNQFAVAVAYSNLESNITESASNVAERDTLWAATNLYFFVNCMQAVGNDVDVIIDSITVETNPPSAVPSGVNALGLDSEVLLTWDHAAGAAEYDVFRSTSSGSYGAAIARVSADSYTDNTVVNGTEYFYTVEAVYYNGNSAKSSEISASPAKVFAGEGVISSDWSGYASADLAGQDSWKAITGSGANAFNVTAGEAETISAESNFALTNGNAVYLDNLLRNDVDDTIEGYIDVVISTYASNNIGDTADMSNQGVLEIGLTGSTGDALRPAGNNSMALMYVGVRNNGNFYLTFGNTANDEDGTRLGFIPRDDAGWNPNKNAWDFPGEPMDYESDSLRIMWKIRKTREEGIYQAWGSISNLQSGFVATFTGPEFMTISRPDLYDLPAAYFTVGHSYLSRHIDNGRVRDSMMHAAISELSVTHNGQQLPDPRATTIESIVSVDRAVQFEWVSILDATGYDIIIDTPSTGEFVLESDYADTSYEDSPRWNDVTNTYTVRVNFDSDVTPNYADVQFDAAPLGLVNVIAANQGGWTSGGTVNADVTSTLTTNGLRYVDYMTTPVFENGVDGYTGPTLYGLFQGDAAGTSISLSAEPNKIQYNHGGWGLWGQELAFTTIADIGDGSITSYDATATKLYYYVRAQNWSFGEWNFEFRAAIRNGSTWYVSATSLGRSEGGGGGGDKPILLPDIMDETWHAITVIPGQDMAVGAAVDNSTLTDVNAVGWYGRQLVNLGLYDLELKASGALGSYDWWAQDAGLDLESPDSDGTADPDDDGLSNAEEYALGGDPLDAQNVGTLPAYSMTNEGGTDGILVVHNELRDPGAEVTYSLEMTDSLTVGSFAPDASTYVGEGNVDYYWKAVTNFVPADVPAKFIKLDIQ